MSASTHNQWHLSKSVPLSLILALCIHIFTSIWWAAGTDFQVKANAREITEIRQMQQEMMRMQTLIETLARESREHREETRELRNDIRETMIRIGRQER